MAGIFYCVFFFGFVSTLNIGRIANSAISESLDLKLWAEAMECCFDLMALLSRP